MDKINEVYQELLNDELKEAEVKYTLFADQAAELVKTEIKDFLNLTDEEFDKLGDITVEVADTPGKIISTVFHGFHTPENEAEATELINSVILINLETFYIDEDEFFKVTEDEELHERLLKKLNELANTKDFKQIIFIG